MDAPSVQEARKEDIEQAIELTVRMKRLNNEFDPLFAVAEDAVQRARGYLSRSLESESVLLLAATTGKKVVGLLRAELRERIFYRPSIEGHITDFYILPEFRRKNLGNEMLGRAAKSLRKLGAEVITAEVPAQNEIAVKFYTKRGFSALTNIFAETID